MLNKLDLSKELAGRRALVTGGTRGIGAAIAQRLLDAGASVVVTARSRNEASPAAATFVAGDLGTEKGAKAVASEALRVLGGLDVLVNNAGGAQAFPKGSETITDEAWQDAFALNLFAATRLSNALLPALRESGSGSIVNISSTAATMPFGPFAHYCAAKAALDMYSRTLAMEVAASGVRVNVVTPGPVVTPSADELRKEFVESLGLAPDAWLSYVPLGRLGLPEDVAEVVALLASDRGKWLTGVNYRVDGGMAAR